MNLVRNMVYSYFDIIIYMTKYFKTFKRGKKHGLPRPMVQLDDYFLNNFSEGLYKNNPVPWQSTPIFNEKGNIFYVIEENEKRVLPEGLCGYCSIKFKNEINFCIFLFNSYF